MYARHQSIACGLSALALWATVSTAHASAQAYEAYAYAADGGALLYRESHWIYTENGVEQFLVVYSCPNGEPFARKHVDMAPGAAIPDFDMFDARSGSHEGVRTRNGHREVFMQTDARTPERHAALSLPENAVIDAGMDAFVRTHWNAISETGLSPVAILVASRLDSLNFSARKLRDTRIDGHDVRWVRFSLANLIGFVLPHIDFGYDASTLQLREYRGLINIRSRTNGNLDVRIDFPPKERRTDVDPSEIARAAAVPLTGRCVFP